MTNDKHQIRLWKRDNISRLHKWIGGRLALECLIQPKRSQPIKAGNGLVCRSIVIANVRTACVDNMDHAARST